MSTHRVTIASAEEIGQIIAAQIAEGIAQAAGRNYVLGCPTGRTPLPVYRALAALAQERKLDLSPLVIALMDDYLVPGEGGSFVHVPSERSYSCVGFAQREIVEPLQRAGTAAVRLIYPDPNDPGRYDRELAQLGGIDFFILASGASDGHIAFNPVGAPRDSQTRIIELARATRTDNLATFPEFAGLEQVPRHGISVGIGTIIDQSRRVAMILTGPDKREAFARISEAQDYCPDWPATAFALCEDGQLYADPAAASTDLATTNHKGK